MLDSREVDAPGPTGRGVPGAEPDPVADRARRTSRSASTGSIRRASRAERREIVDYYLDRVGLGDAMDKLGGRALERHAPARRHRPRLRAEPEAAAARRAVRHARQPHALGAAGRADGGVERARKVTAICVTHDVDEAILLADRVVMMTNGPNAHDRQDPRGRPAAPAQPQGAARAPGLLPLPRRGPRLPRGIRGRRHATSHARRLRRGDGRQGRLRRRRR